jgi:hypothetical protein
VEFWGRDGGELGLAGLESPDEVVVQRHSALGRLPKRAVLLGGDQQHRVEVGRLAGGLLGRRIQVVDQDGGGAGLHQGAVHMLVGEQVRGQFVATDDVDQGHGGVEAVDLVGGQVPPGRRQGLEVAPGGPCGPAHRNLGGGVLGAHHLGRGGVPSQVGGGRAERDQHRVGSHRLLQRGRVRAGVGRRIHRRYDQRQPGRRLRRRGAEGGFVHVVVVGCPPGRVHLRRDQQQVRVVAVGMGEHGLPPEPGVAERVQLVSVDSGLPGPGDQPPVDLRAQFLIDPHGLRAVQRRVRPISPLPLHVRNRQMSVPVRRAGRTGNAEGGGAQPGRPGQQSCRRIVASGLVPVELLWHGHTYGEGHAPT